MKNLLLWSLRITPLRIAMALALAASTVHFIIENDSFEYGILSHKGFLHQLDLKVLDLKLVSRKMGALPPPLVTVAEIDERSIERYGLWPFSRTVIADFITAATAQGAAVVAFDAVFSDANRNTAHADVQLFLDQFNKEELRGDPKALAESLRSQRGELAQQLKSLQKIARDATGPERGPLEKQVRELRQLQTTLSESLSAVSGQVESVSAVHAFMTQMQELADRGNPDVALRKAIENSPQTVLGMFGFYNEDEIVGLDLEVAEDAARHVEKVSINNLFETRMMVLGGTPLTQTSPVEEVDVANMQVREMVALRAPLPQFGEVAQGFGYFNVTPDRDGPMRSIRMLNLFRGKLYPSLSLIAAARWLDTDMLPINGTIKKNVTMDGILLGETLVPTNFHGHFLINYYTEPTDYFPHYSIADFIEGTVPKEHVQDKVVLFGMTAQGLFDLRPTPFSSTTPGVYIHASAIQNILDGNFLERYYGIALIEILAFLALGLFMGLVLPRIPPWGGILVTAGVIIGIFVLDTVFFFPKGYWVITVLPSLECLTIYLGILLHGYLTEGREKRKIRTAFQYYLTKSVVDEMLKSPEKLKLGGEKRVCTVLFSDIRGFTTISERLSPERLSALLNEYLTPMTNLVFKYDGTLDKYMGDAIMAIFGAPVAYDDHAARACFTALEMMEELAILQEGWRERGVPELDIGIGLNSGPMSVGNMGSQVRFDYTVMGDNVNLGSRLEGINKQYGTNIIISEATRTAAGERIYVREMDAVRVKGKRDPVRIFELLGRGEPPPLAKQLIESFHAGVAAYKKQDWDGAVLLFDKVRKELKPNDYASTMYIERCEGLRANPPGADWDGVYTMTTK
jgi:adenylate cyclase